MGKELSGMSIISLVLIYLAITMAGKTTVDLEKYPKDLSIVDEGIELDQEPIINVTWIQVKLTMGYKNEYENGTVTRLIHNNNGPVYNVTVTVRFHYENATYRGYTEETYFVTDYIEGRGEYAAYYEWDITEIDGLYYGAEAYGWQERTEVIS